MSDDSKSQAEAKKKSDADAKKKLKVIKAALMDERKARTQVAEALESLTKRHQELEAEYEVTNNKYLELYEQNDKLSENLQMLQYRLSSSGGSHEKEDDRDVGLIADLKNEVKTVKGLFTKNENNTEEIERVLQERMDEQMRQHETELSAISSALDKAKRECGYQEQQMMHYKKMATELAE